MKGPFERLKYDLRRVWECPQCGHKQRTEGTVTTAFCRCGKPNTNPAIPMKLVGDGPRRLVPKVAPPVREEALTSVTQVEVIAFTSSAAVVVVDTEIAIPANPPSPEPEPEA